MTGLGGKELARVQTAHNAIAVRIDASQICSRWPPCRASAVRPGPQLRAGPERDGALRRRHGRAGGRRRRHRRAPSRCSTRASTTRTATSAARARSPRTTRPRARPLPTRGTRPATACSRPPRWSTATTSSARPGRTATCADDPDPIDFEGHGTHVADIIAGQSLDGTHKGVAPGAKLLAVKVCSAVATSCSGIALLQGVDFALDPNGDGDTRDAVDVINMSLGSSYGQIEDDLTPASNNAVRLGVVVVASAGNSANQPYIVGLAVDRARGDQRRADRRCRARWRFRWWSTRRPSIAGMYANTQTMDWAPVSAGVTGDVAFSGAVARLAASRRLAGGPVAGQPGRQGRADRPRRLLRQPEDRPCRQGRRDRRADRPRRRRAMPSTFSFGGGDTFVPDAGDPAVAVATRSRRSSRRRPVNVTISPAAAIPLVGSMAASSSRGPSDQHAGIKPEIGAPGASLSAEAGTGTARRRSAAPPAPRRWWRAPRRCCCRPTRTARRAQIKAMLMNSAETDGLHQPGTLPGELAPITPHRRGRSPRRTAVALTTRAWDRERSRPRCRSARREVAASTTVLDDADVSRTSASARAATAITPSFRYADDEASGAVRVIAPASRDVGPNGDGDLTVQLHDRPVQAADLDAQRRLATAATARCSTGPSSTATSRSRTARDKLSVPWHVLPRKAPRTTPRRWSIERLERRAEAQQRGVRATGAFDVFSLTGTSPAIPQLQLPQPGDNCAVIDLRSVGVRYLPANVGGGLPRVRDQHLRRAARIPTTRPSSTSTSTPPATGIRTSWSTTPRTVASARRARTSCAWRISTHAARHGVLLHRRRPELGQRDLHGADGGHAGSTPGTTIRLRRLRVRQLLHRAS